MFIDRPEAPSKAIKAGFVWDQKSVDYFTGSNQFNVLVTSVSKRRGFGTINGDNPMREQNGTEVSGVILYPRLILVTITIEKDPCGEFGVWAYRVHIASDGSKNVEVPVLEFLVNDPIGDIAEGLYEGQRAALAAGRRYSPARFWKRKGDGALTSENGTGGESRYPLFGMYTWAELEAAGLPHWALPIWNDKFSLSQLPHSSTIGNHLAGAVMPAPQFGRWCQRIAGSWV